MSWLNTDKTKDGMGAMAFARGGGAFFLDSLLSAMIARVRSFDDEISHEGGWDNSLPFEQCT